MMLRRRKLGGWRPGVGRVHALLRLSMMAVRCQLYRYILMRIGVLKAGEAMQLQVEIVPRARTFSGMTVRRRGCVIEVLRWMTAIYGLVM